MKSIITIIFCALVYMMSACSQSAKTEQAASDTVVSVIDSIIIDTIDSIPADTTAIDSLPERRYFYSQKAALDFVRGEEYGSVFKNSIIPQMIKDHFPYAQRLLNSKYDRFIVVDKYSMRVMLFDRCGRLERAYKMACGRNYGTKHEKADERTPEGFFSVEGIYDSTDWLFTDDDGVTSKIKGQFGPRFIRVRIPETSQIGIHGTCSPRSIGWRCSHGCIRITNEQILELVEFVVPGMPVIINPGRRDTRTNLEEGYDIPWISVAPDTARYRRPKFTPRPPIDTVLPDSILIRPLETDSAEKITIKIDTIKPMIPTELDSLPKII